VERFGKALRRAGPTARARFEGWTNSLTVRLEVKLVIGYFTSMASRTWRLTSDIGKISAPGGADDWMLVDNRARNLARFLDSGFETEDGRWIWYVFVTDNDEITCYCGRAASAEEAKEFCERLCDHFES